MTVADHLRQADRCLFSFEILPPAKGKGVSSIFETVEALLRFKPAFIDVTGHATQVVYQDAGNGMLRKVPVQKRPGTLGVCAAIKYKYGIDTVPHMICSGFTADETEDALIELSYLGIDSIMALRGDPSHGEKRFVPEPGGHSYALGLVDQIAGMNRGQGLYAPTEPTGFCIGVAGYPEKHMEAPNFEEDLRRLKDKVDAGAEFIVTQMFFDNQRFFAFREACVAAGITVPIIPGLKPLTTRSQISVLPQTFHIDLPSALVLAVEQCKTEAEVRKVGIEWCIEQSRELAVHGAPSLHYYTMGRSEAVRQIASAVFA